MREIEKISTKRESREKITEEEIKEANEEKDQINETLKQKVKNFDKIIWTTTRTL